MNVNLIKKEDLGKGSNIKLNVCDAEVDMYWKVAIEVLETIEKLNREEGITVISITHYMDEAARADRVIVLSDGRLMLDGTPGEVFTHSDTLRKAGLDLPQCTAVAQHLITHGFPIGGEINTPEQCAEAILNAWKKM